jgi:hypothetical protein
LPAQFTRQGNAHEAGLAPGGQGFGGEAAVAVHRHRSGAGHIAGDAAHALHTGQAV